MSDMFWCAPAGRDGYQQTFDATLVGADRTKDLAVVQINAPKVRLRMHEAHIRTKSHMDD